MEQPSNPPPIDHSGFTARHSSSVSINDKGNNQGDHGHHHQVASLYNAFSAAAFAPDAFVGSGNNGRGERQSFSPETYAKDINSNARDAFGRDSYSAEGGAVNYPDVSIPRDRETTKAETESTGDGFHRREGDDSLLSGGVVAFTNDGGGSSTGDERESKRAKRVGWWHDDEGIERPPDHGRNSSSGDGMEAVEVSTEKPEVSMVNAESKLGVLRGLGVSGGKTSVRGGGSAVAEMLDGSGEAGEVDGGILVFGGRGGVLGNADGEAGLSIDLGDGGGSAGVLDGELGDDIDQDGRDGDGREKGDKDAIGKKKRAELWQDAEMDALVGAYRQIHTKLSGKKGKNVFKSANEKWKEVRNLLLLGGVDRQPKEIERKWSNLSTAFKQIADWNKKANTPSYWDLDESLKKEKTKAKELPATFRVQLYESMAEFLGDRTAARRARGYDQTNDRTSLPGGSGNGGSAGNEGNSGFVDIPLPMDKLASHQPSLDVLHQKRLRVVLVATGSYNPPTYMHLRMFEVARDALTGEGYDVLGGYMSPVNDGYSKKGLAPAEHRIALCQMATSDSSFIMVDTWEAKQRTYQRTLAVLNRVDHAVNRPGLSDEEKVRVMLLCGADLLESIITPGVWIPEQTQTLLRDYGVVCVQRNDTDVRKLIFENDLLYENRRNISIVNAHITNDISSSSIRRNLARGLSIKYLTTDSVIHYIKMHRLYDPAQW